MLVAKSLHEVLEEREHHEFLEYAQQAGLDELFRGDAAPDADDDATTRGSNFTVFVPSDAYFASTSPQSPLVDRGNGGR